jgi:hypothetical protein
MRKKISKFTNLKIMRFLMSRFEENNELEKLKKENKRLRTSNIILTIYAILSLIVMAYNYWF